MISDFLSKNVFIEWPREIRFQHVSIKKCFSNDSPNKFKVLFILIINVRIRVRLEGIPTLWRQEQTVIWVEDFLR